MTTAPGSILQAFLEHARHDPARPCLHWGARWFSYGELAAAALGWAELLCAQGVVRGDRVGLYLDNSPDFIAAYLGAHMAGAATVLLNTQYRQTELQHILSDSAPRVVVTGAAGRIEIERADVPGVVVVDGASDSVHRPSSTVLDLSSLSLPAPDDLAILAYTSGTTGRSKGAMLSHANLASNSAAVIAAWRWTAQDTLLLMLPLFHIHGLGVGVNGTLLVGGALDLRPRFEAAEALEALMGGQISMFFGVPTMYTRLIAEAIKYKTRNPAFAPPPIRLFVSGSAPLDPQTFVEFAQLFGQPILERYGMSETVMNTTNPYDGERRAGTVGMPFPGQEARIVDVRTREPLPDGEAGEIQVRGQHVCKGYWRNPEATAAAFDSAGWFSTGDLGFRSPDGYITIAGRAKELIISGGYNIYPREVEEVLLTHPAIAEAAVVGRPDPDLGESVVAFVVLKAGTTATADELVEFCKTHLASYKKPRRISFVERLPRNAMGKVQKHLLGE